jgi:hypothetical protein
MRRNGLAHGLCRLHTIHHRHDHVHEDQIKALLTPFFQRLCAVFGLDHRAGRPAIFQHLFDQQAVQSVVIHHQKMPGLAGGLQHLGRLGLHGPGCLLRAQRQAEPETRALAGGAVKTDLAIQQLHQTLRDGQAQAIAAIAFLNLALGLHEAGKNMGLVVKGNANARVLHLKQHARVVPLHTQHHLALVREFEGIAQQVDQDLHQAVPVGADPLRHVVFNFAAVGQLHAFDARHKQIKGMAHRLAQSKGFGMRSQPAR